MQDPFIGTWRLNPAKSAFDPNHRPTGGTMTWELDAEGNYSMKAEGLNAKGEKVVERPQRMIPDGRGYPIADFPGLTTITTRLDSNAIRVEARREDNSVAGEGTYAVSADGASMTATTAGFDTQLRRFETRTVWERLG
jgi:hypothetical protein